MSNPASTNPNLRCLEIGGGSKPRKGFSQLDHKTRGAAFDLITDPLPGMWDYIYMSHVLEHIPYEHALPCLKKIYDAVSPSSLVGLVRIIVPDLRALATAYLDNDINFFEQSVGRTPQTNWLGAGGRFVGNIISPGSDTHLYTRDKKTYLGGRAHQMAYDAPMLKAMLEKAGFCSVTQKELEAWDTWYGKTGQLVMEATK